MKLGKVVVAAALLGIAGAAVFAFARPDAVSFNPKKVSNETVTSAATVADRKTPPDTLQFHLVPSSATLAKCMPHAKVDITVKLRTDKIGKDIFIVDASGLPANTSFTTFMLEVPGAPFGAAEYFGDVDSNKYGKAHAEFELIVQEAFASTLVDGKRVRVDLNHVGMWFAAEMGAQRLDAFLDDFVVRHVARGDGEVGN